MDEDNKTAGGSSDNNSGSAQSSDNSSDKFVLAKHTVIQPISSDLKEEKPESADPLPSTPSTQDVPQPVQSTTDVVSANASNDATATETIPLSTASIDATNAAAPAVQPDLSANNAPASTPPASTMPQPVLNSSTNTVPQPGVVVSGGPEQNATNQETVVVGAQSATNVTPTVVSSNPAGSQSNVESKSTKKLSKMLIVAVVAAVVVVGGAVAALVILNGSDSPSVVFKDALINSLSTTKMEQDATQQGTTGKLLLDDTNASKPIIDVKATVNLFGINLELDGWGNTQDGFIRYNISGQGQGSASTMNKWAQTEKNGQLISGVGASEQYIFDPYNAITGQWITGNFNSSDRNTLVNYDETHNVYKYNVKKVTSGNIGGQSVYVYNVTVNNSALTSMNKMAEKMMGLSAKEESFINSNRSIPSPDTITVYIYKNSKQIAKAVLHDKTNGDTTNVYTFGSIVQVPPMPKPQIKYSAIATQLSGM